VIPSWDPFLDEYARLGSNQAEHTLIALLHRWLPPRWLQPVPFQLPRISGFEDQSVAVFAVVDVQDNATALSRLAEYFVEMGQLDAAASASQALERSYPADLGALVARALVAHARGDSTGFGAVVNDLEPHLARGEDRAMPWDRRVSLAVALTQGKHMERAREQVRQCLAGMDEPRLRSLSTVSLFRLQMMAKAFGIAFADERLREVARQLLPTEMRARL
jgi:tetratricopeptide (TPR) repeat protein